MKIIKIGSSWCSGCVVMKPRWENIQKIRNIKTEYYDFDIYEDELKEKYHIGDKLPIAIFVNNDNQEIDRIIGEIKETELLELIDRYGDK